MVLLEDDNGKQSQAIAVMVVTCDISTTATAFVEVIGGRCHAQWVSTTVERRDTARRYYIKGVESVLCHSHPL